MSYINTVTYDTDKTAQIILIDKSGKMVPKDSADTIVLVMIR